MISKSIIVMCGNVYIALAHVNIICDLYKSLLHCKSPCPFTVNPNHYLFSHFRYAKHIMKSIDPYFCLKLLFNCLKNILFIILVLVDRSAIDRETHLIITM